MSAEKKHPKVLLEIYNAGRGTKRVFFMILENDTWKKDPRKSGGSIYLFHSSDDKKA